MKISKKGLISVAAILGIAALASTTFATFIITGGNKSSTVTPTINVGTVTNKLVALSASLSDESVDFDASSEATGRVTGYGEDLSFSVAVSVTGDIDSGTPAYTKIALTASATGNGVTSNYFTLPAEFDVTKSALNSFTKTGSDSSTVVSGTATLSFAWGTAFNSMNPAKYYDSDSKGEAVSDADVVTALNAMKTSISGTVVTITVTVS
jgi:hypothetical protein